MLYILIVKVFGPWPERWYLLLPLGWGEYYTIYVREEQSGYTPELTHLIVPGYEPLTGDAMGVVTIIYTTQLTMLVIPLSICPVLSPLS